MQHIYKPILAAMVAVLTLAGCQNEDSEPEAVSDYPIFSATIEAARSRAFDTSWETGDQIGVTGGGKTNVRHDTANGDGLFEVYGGSKNQIIFTDNDPVEFIAYYPYYSNRPADGIIKKSRTSTSSNLTTTTQTNQKNFDFLWAKASGSKRSPKVKFEFAHVMSKISFVFKNGVDMDVSEIASYTLNGFVTSGQFNTNKGECSVTSTSTGKMTVTVSGVVSGEPAKPCIVFPQTLNEIPVMLNVKSTGSPYAYLTCMLPFESQEIEAGNEYRFVITVNKTGLTVDEATISEWVEVDRGDNWEAF